MNFWKRPTPERPADWDEVHALPLTPEASTLVESGLNSISCFVGFTGIEQRLKKIRRPVLEYSFKKATLLLPGCVDLELLCLRGYGIELSIPAQIAKDKAASGAII